MFPNTALRGVPVLYRSQLIRALILAGALTLGASGAALAGQPNASCEDSRLQPAGFSSGGFANADLHYAGERAPSLNANSGKAVSQYDVACYRISLHHPA